MAGNEQKLDPNNFCLADVRALWRARDEKARTTLKKEAKRTNKSEALAGDRPIDERQLKLPW